MESKARRKKQHILKAAVDVILDADFQSLTLDAVAKKGEISKGGLLYHFPNKEALLQELSKYVLDEFMSLFNEHAEKDSIEKGKWCRALIEVSLWDIEHRGKLNVGLAATSMLEPSAAKNLSELYQYMQKKVEDDGVNAVTATIIRLTMDGLYYSQLFNLTPLDEQLQEKVIAQLIAMTK